MNFQIQSITEKLEQMYIQLKSASSERAVIPQPMDQHLTQFIPNHYGPAGQKKLELKTMKVLKNPPLKRKIPIMEIGPLSVNQQIKKKLPKPDDDYGKPQFDMSPSMYQRQRTLNFSPPRPNSQIKKQDVEEMGVLKLIQRGEIPAVADLSPIFKDQIKVFQAGSYKQVRGPPAVSQVSMLNKFSDLPGVELLPPHGKSHLKQMTNEVEDFVNDLQKMAVVDDDGSDEHVTISAQDLVANVQKIAQSTKTHWTQLGPRNFTGHSHFTYKEEQRLLFYDVDLQTIPIMGGQIIKNVQYIALLQKFDFMRHIILDIFARVTREIKGDDEGEIRIENIVNIAYQLFFGEIEDYTMDDLFKVQSSDTVCEIQKVEEVEVVPEDPMQAFYGRHQNKIIGIQRYFRMCTAMQKVKVMLKEQNDTIEEKFRVQQQKYDSLVQNEHKKIFSSINNQLFYANTTPPYHQQQYLNGSLNLKLLDISGRDVIAFVFAFEKFDEEILNLLRDPAAHLIIFGYLVSKEDLNRLVAPQNLEEMYSRIQCFEFEKIKQDAIEHLTTFQKIFKDQDHTAMYSEIYSYMRFKTNTKQFIDQIANCLINARSHDIVFALTQTHQTTNKNFLPLVKALELACPAPPENLLNLEVYQKLFSHFEKLEIGDYHAIQPQQKVLCARPNKSYTGPGQDLIDNTLGGRHASFFLGGSFLQVFQSQDPPKNVVLTNYPEDIRCFLSTRFTYSPLLRQLSGEQLKKFCDHLVQSSVEHLDAASYVSFGRSTCFGQLSPSWSLGELAQTAEFEPVLWYFNRMFKQLLEIFDDYDCPITDVVLGYILCERSVQFNQVAFGADTQATRECPGEDFRHQAYQIRANGVYNQQIQDQNVLTKVFEQVKDSTLIHQVFRIERRNVELIPAQLVSFDILIKQESLKQAIQQFGLIARNIQQISGNEDQVKQAVAQKDTLGLQHVQWLLEAGGSSPFCTAVVNGLLSRWKAD